MELMLIKLLKYLRQEKMDKILILANHYNTLIIFPRELIKALAENSNTVIVAIPRTEINNIEMLKSYGCQVIITNMKRRGKNPLSELLLIIYYFRIIHSINPDRVLTYTIKPNIYGSIVSKVFGKDCYVNITGLGSAFYSGGIVRQLVIILYKFAIKKSKKVFFENIGDCEYFVEKKIAPKYKTAVFPGAGVNLKEYPFTNYPKSETLNFLFLGRIMHEKGVDELFAAIEKIKKIYPLVKFSFVGWYEEDYRDKIANLEKKELIKYYGFQQDVKPFIRDSHCVVLPSYHEGMSNTLLESAAMGRPLIASNIYGCKEAIIDGENGFLCKAKDCNDLFLKLKKFIELSTDERIKMGYKSRIHMEKHFDKYKVVDMTLNEIFN